MFCGEPSLAVLDLGWAPASVYTDPALGVSQCDTEQSTASLQLSFMSSSGQLIIYLWLLICKREPKY